MGKYLTIPFLFLFLNTYCQNKDSIPATKHMVKVLGQATPEKILLRWAPSSPYSWKVANQEGFIIERQLIVKAGKIVEPRPAFKKLVNQPLKPLPLDAWEPLSKTDNLSPIAAQALYGDSFEISQQGTTKAKNSAGMVQLLNQASELENRYSFALFAADLSVNTAKASALFYEDSQVAKDEMYLYRVYVAGKPQNTLPIDTGYVYLGIADYSPLPRIRQVDLEFSDKSVLISWDKKPYNQFFTAYIIERSDDGGKNFKPITELPFLNTEPYAARQDIRKNYKIDSLPQNGKEYFYRIKGLNAFGQTSLASDTASGEGYIPLRGNPTITKAEELKNRSIQIFWEFPSETLTQVKGFQIERSSLEREGYKILNTNLLSSSIATFTDPNPNRVNYYRIKALGKKPGEYALSFPYRILGQDSVPPAPPVGGQGVVDSLGIVKISWQKNLEKDLFGYRIFRGNAEQLEFIQISKQPVRDTIFIDTLTLNTISKKVYYKLVALDEVFNPSGFSQTIVVQIPDKVPPVAPVFKTCEARIEGIYLEWKNSSSIDVTHHLLYKNTQGSQEWKLLKSFQNKDTTYYTDKEVDPEIAYKYTIVAVDEGGLESAPSRPVQAQLLDGKQFPAVEAISAISDRTQTKGIELSWQYAQKDIIAFRIYRAEQGMPLRLLTTIQNANARKYLDTEVTLNKIYQYAIIAVFKNDAQSRMPIAVSVKY